jgi:hypothetical protein
LGRLIRHALAPAATPVGAPTVVTTPPTATTPSLTMTIIPLALATLPLPAAPFPLTTLPLPLTTLPLPLTTLPLPLTTLPLPLTTLPLPLAIIPLTVAMIFLPLFALLMPPLGGANLLAPRLAPALIAAIALSAIAAHADTEQCPAAVTLPHSEFSFALCHRTAASAVFDKDNWSVRR